MEEISYQTSQTKEHKRGFVRSHLKIFGTIQELQAAQAEMQISGQTTPKQPPGTHGNVGLCQVWTTPLFLEGFRAKPTLLSSQREVQNFLPADW